MLDLIASPDLPRTAALLALAVWLSLAVFNNCVDRETNIHLIGTMFRMDLLIEDGTLGQGLLKRRKPGEGAARRALFWVIVIEIIISALLWIAALASGLNWLGYLDDVFAKAALNVAVGSFFALWTAFLCGGLYFGYWIKTPQVQQVHFTLFIIGLLLWQMAH